MSEVRRRPTDPAAMHQRMQTFLSARRRAYDRLVEVADLERIVVDREYEAELSAAAERAAAKEIRAT